MDAVPMFYLGFVSVLSGKQRNFSSMCLTRYTRKVWFDWLSINIVFKIPFFTEIKTNTLGNTDA
jgi:hypothetical protein